MPLLKTITQALKTLWDIFASEQKSSLKTILCLIPLCLVLGLGASGVLYICLKTLQCSFSVALAACGTFAVITAGALLFSKYLRCFTLIFLISCGTQQGRNSLITAGTAIVIYNCAKNSFHNLNGLAQCIICNLEDKLSIIADLLEKYIEVSKLWGSLLTKTTKVDESFHNHLKASKLHLKKLGHPIILAFQLVLQVFTSTLAILSVLLVLVSTGFHVRKYVHNVEFENIFITEQFEELDKKNCNEGKPQLLPLKKREKKHFIKIPSLRLSAKEWKATMKFFTPISVKILLWAIVILTDYGLYLLISSIRIHFVTLPDINLSVSTQADDSYRAPLFKHDCFPQTTLAIDGIWIPLTGITSILMLLTLLSARLTTLKILVLSSFYPEARRDRAYFLYYKITRKRSSEKSLRDSKKSLNIVVNSVLFWFPIFKMKKNKEGNEQYKPNDQDAGNNILTMGTLLPESKASISSQMENAELENHNIRPCL